MVQPTEPQYLTIPLGNNAEVNDLPLSEASAEEGQVTINSLFPPITQIPLDAGGIPPERLDMNGLFKLIGAKMFWDQCGGLYFYKNTLDYVIGNIIATKTNNDVFNFYICIANNGVSSVIKEPTDPNYWKLILTLNNENNLIFNGIATSANRATTADLASNATYANRAGIAQSATNATNANHATTADNATRANRATRADLATKANNATTAETAIKAQTDLNNNDLRTYVKSLGYENVSLTVSDGYGNVNFLKINKVEQSNFAYNTVEKPHNTNNLTIASTGFVQEQLKHILGGKSFYKINQLIDKPTTTAKTGEQWIRNASTGLSGVNRGDLYLYDDVTNYDAILVTYANDGLEYFSSRFIPTWEFLYMIGSPLSQFWGGSAPLLGRTSLVDDNTEYWDIYCVREGTTTRYLRFFRDNGIRIMDIYGIKYSADYQPIPTPPADAPEYEFSSGIKSRQIEQSGAKVTIDEDLDSVLSTFKIIE